VFSLATFGDRADTLEMQESSPVRSTALLNRKLDFWLLGGASILLWLLMIVADLFRAQAPVVEQHFLQIAASFGLISLFTNYPHFVMSYRLGYSRGQPFVKKHWFSLVGVPLTLIVLFTVAFLKFDSTIVDAPWIIPVNHFFEWLHIEFRFGTLDNLGSELLSLGVWAMYLTVGWHYSKQVFGCMMAYAHYDSYPLQKWQRLLIKINLFAIAFFNFFYINSNWNQYETALNSNYFFFLRIVPLGLPGFFLYLAAGAVVATTLSILAGIVFLNRKQNQKKWPSRNFLVSWVAFHIWWIPLILQKEYYLILIPLFHAIQYLPFAYRMERRKMAETKTLVFGITIRLLFVLAVGFLMLEAIPSFLDDSLNTNVNQTPWFFMIAFVLFINIHHYFIDSVVWKLREPEVRNHLFYD
jgi:hypothetical protein